MNDYAHCPLCGTLTETALTRVLRRGHGTVFHCLDCDHGFLISKKVDAKEYYDGRYREQVSHHAKPAPTNPQEIFDVYSKYQSDRLERVLPYVKSDSIVLEIGASAGQFMSYLDGKCARRCAIELDSACCEFMAETGIEVDSNFLSESRFAKDKFDIVVSFQTLEHVADPVQFLRDVWRALKPGGVAFIEVPNLRESLLSVWDIPAYTKFYFHSDHLSYFSSRSLTKVARNAGFYDLSINYTQDYNLLSHISFIINNEPMATCEIGLGPVSLKGKNTEISEWLSSELASLNARYITKLQALGATSNLMMFLTRT